MAEGQLHEISAAIGELRAYMHDARHDVNNLSAKIDGLAVKLEQLDAELTLDKGDLAKLRAKGLGVLIGVSIVSGLVGTKLPAVVQAVLKTIP